MAKGIFALVLSLAAAAEAVSLDKRSNCCDYVPYMLNGFNNGAGVTSFCSSLLQVPTSTVTATSTAVINASASTVVNSVISAVTTITTSVTATCATAALKKRDPWGWGWGWQQPTSTAPSYSCSTLPSNYWPCGATGWLSYPAQIPCSSNPTSMTQCRDACLGNPQCQSFSWDTQCKHFSKSLTSQGLQVWGNSGTVMYNRLCFTNCKCNGPNTVVPTVSSTAGFAYPTPFLSSICSCLSIPTPKSTLVLTSTVTSTGVITTFTSVSTSITGTSVTTTTVAQVPYQQQGTYSTGASTFNLYPNTDFYGYNLYWGYCGATSNPLVTGRGNYTCNSFSDCLSVCDQYNTAAVPGDGFQKCLGISFSTGSPNCYLKYAVPGNGSPSCQVQESQYEVDSAVLQ